MKVLLLGREKDRNIFTTIAKILELEKADTDFLFFDLCSSKEFMQKLYDADLFLLFPGEESHPDAETAEHCRICSYEKMAFGYLLAHKGRILFFASNPEKLNVLFKSEPVVSCIGDALAIFRREKKAFESSRKYLAARKKITDSELSFSRTGMVQAVDYGMYPETQAFLEAGFSAENENANGVPLLSLAVRNRDVEITRLLMSYNASLNVIARDRTTSPLMDAVTLNDEKLAVILIEAGADLNFRNRNGQSALIVAIGSRMQGIARLLIEKGADITIKDSLGMTAADYAKLFSMTDLFPLLGLP